MVKINEAVASRGAPVVPGEGLRQVHREPGLRLGYTVSRCHKGVGGDNNNKNRIGRSRGKQAVLLSHWPRAS